MAQKKNGFADFLRGQADVIQSRIHDFQKEADKLASELSSRGQAQIKELEKLVAKLESAEWVDRSQELAERAKVFGGELAGHLEEFQGKLANFVGVATRDQVSDLAKELKALSKKIDSLMKNGRASSRAVAK
jgi:ABC-type transporter Mla subunit MlaD